MGYLVLAEWAEPSAGDIRAFLAARLAEYKLPDLFCCPSGVPHDAGREDRLVRAARSRRRECARRAGLAGAVATGGGVGADCRIGGDAAAQEIAIAFYLTAYSKRSSQR